VKSQYFAGVDIGSTMTKVVIMSEATLTPVIGPTGPEHRKLANRVMEEALAKARLSFDEITYWWLPVMGELMSPLLINR